MKSEKDYSEPNERQKMKNAVRAVLYAMRTAKQTHLITGAFGCGTCANAPEEIAQVFLEVLETDEFRGQIETIVLAIPEEKGQSRRKAVFRSMVLNGLEAYDQRERWK